MLIAGALVLLVCLLMALIVLAYVLRSYVGGDAEELAKRRQGRLLDILVGWGTIGACFAFFSAMWTHAGTCALFGATFTCGKVLFFITSLPIMILTWPMHMAGYTMLAMYGDKRFVFGAVVSLVVGFCVVLARRTLRS